MRTNSAIANELIMLGANKSTLRSKEVAALENTLHKNESIVCYLHGIFEGGVKALLIGTNQRLLYVNKTPGNLIIEDIPYDMIASIEENTGILWGKVTLTTRSRKYHFTYLPKNTVRPFVSVIEELMKKRNRAVNN